MDRAALDGYLRRHSIGEEVLLARGDSVSSRRRMTSISEEELRESMRKNFPNLDEEQIREDLLGGRPNIFPEDRIRWSGSSILISCHPRFSIVPVHSRSYIEMIYVYDGECRQTINARPTTLRKGELCILSTNTMHSAELTGESDIMINCIMSKEYLERSILERLSAHDPITGFLAKCIYQGDQYEGFMLIDGADSPRLEGLMVQALCEYFDPTLGSDGAVDAYMSLIFTEMLRVYARQREMIEERSSEMRADVYDIVACIRANCGSVTLASLAERFNSNPEYLGAKLKRATGKSFTAIAHEIRMDKARVLLANTTMPTAEIANSVGLQNVSFFYRVFEKAYGCTPGEYRKRNARGGSATGSRN